MKEVLPTNGLTDPAPDCTPDQCLLALAANLVGCSAAATTTKKGA
jgi:hypothetical protein